MKFGMLRHIVLPLVVACLTVGSVRADTFTDVFDIEVSGFDYLRNFWAASNPNATVGGPSPVDSVSMSMTVTYDAPAGRQGAWTPRPIELLDFSVSLVLNDIPGFAPGDQQFSRIRPPTPIMSSPGGTQTGFSTPGTQNSLIFYTLGRFGSDTSYFSFTISLPGALNDTMSLDGSAITVAFNASPIRFDAPQYISRFDPAFWNVTRTTIQAAPGPVPLPAGVVLGLSGLAALIVVRRCRRV